MAEFMEDIDADKRILSSFTKKELLHAIEKINELLFQKRCAPQREIQPETLIDRYPYKLVFRLMSEYRMELYVFYGSFDTTTTSEALQTASDTSGNTLKLEFND